MGDLPDLDYALLDREFDRTKTQVFLGKSASFLGSIMCSMNFAWDESIPTACTNGIGVWWNPHFFLRIPKPTRLMVLVHELWHPGFMDMIRLGDRDPEIWNQAADHRINNMLFNEGYSFEGLGFQPCLDRKYDGWMAEDIYDDLIKDPPPPMPDELRDLLAPPGDGAAHTILNNVVTATHQARMSHGNMPGEIEVTLKQFLAPKLPWATILFNFFNDMTNQDYTWARPNRRYQDIYLPSLQDEDGGLDHIAYFLDVSGSITDGDIIRFHSEFKYVKETFQPEKMTMLQFDTIIQKTDVFEKDDPFEETHVIGRGGTSLSPVREWIIENRPTAVVVFSDLCCEVMTPLPINAKVPIIWVALNNKSAKVNEGQLVHLRE